MRQSCPLIGLELQRMFVEGYSLTMHVKHQEYRVIQPTVHPQFDDIFVM